MGRIDTVITNDRHSDLSCKVDNIAALGGNKCYLALDDDPVDPEIDWDNPVSTGTELEIGEEGLRLVVLDDAVLGKPDGEADAHRMLRALSGRDHRVISGVCVTTRDRTEAFSDTSIVRFAELTDEEIDYYIEHYRPLDKAGAYGIQEWIGNIGISGISGDFYNVMGLPTRKLYQVLKTF